VVPSHFCDNAPGEGLRGLVDVALKELGCGRFWQAVSPKKDNVAGF
jgi:hypothetical protein